MPDLITIEVDPIQIEDSLFDDGPKRMVGQKFKVVEGEMAIVTLDEPVVGELVRCKFPSDIEKIVEFKGMLKVCIF